jgi:15-cis-phytoene synthase
MTAADACATRVRDRDRDRYLATLYAPAAARPALFALHALDIELAAVVDSTTEPMLGQIRLAWWREQLQALDAGAMPAQPTLAALAAEVVPRGISGASLEPLEDASLALFDDDLDAHAAARARLFDAALRVLVPAPDAALVEAARTLGTGWALVDAGRQGRTLTPAQLDSAAATLAPWKAPAGARPLWALAALAHTDVAALRQGRPPEPRGTPGRQARLLWSIMTGR